MEIISWIVMGLVTGSMARVAMPGPAAGGMSIAILIGLVGALIGGSLGTTISPHSLASFDLFPLATAANGALVLLFVYRCIAMRFEVSQPMAERIPIRSNTPDLMATSADRLKV
jgi:uncharacterized membrane protein YeaQ/YmgE (transglycosylase-associated protein family)